ncbi:MAG: IS5 family transposase [Bacteroidetes bacterium]|jgi:transposase, IS5 family|nr:IS5 family transposase [Bacteroidota bacterium]MBT5528578.1 IS5 family transposase [Cytophagia bacterium]MBT3802183.1 IS5 family transposase [Bacteroidota bacterium]MBT3932976.1 IS5 family transposase [Bacteroidota bacterium]MBT4339005.1 IS5 family transposase [Bacteroidota bacterium]
MIRYTPESQLTIEGFETPFQASLSPDNRWVKLSKIVPWDKFAGLYISKMNADFGRPGISPRAVLGAMIIKHIEKLDDRGVIASIQENIYMQFFVGLPGFKNEPIFDPSLFVEIRKRIGADSFDALNVALIESISKDKDNKHLSRNKKQDKNRDMDNTGAGENIDDPKPAIPNKGKLQIDATVADQYITYPTDTGLLRQSTKQCEKLIDILYKLQGKKETKPRTYRRKLDKCFLVFSKKRKKTKNEIRKTNRIFLEALQRDIKHINRMLDSFDKFPLNKEGQKMLWVVSLLYEQQKQMYDNKTNSCDDRIVSIFQPHVRPIVRGKQKLKVEFGSKLGISLDNGLARIGTMSWDAYNESGDLEKQVEAYKELHGFYPELVQADKIYATNKNRKYLNGRGIRLTASPLGRRKTKNQESYYKKRKRKKEATERNQIEGKFGQGKNGYELNRIRAKLIDTSESWVSAIIFIMNLICIRDMRIIWSVFFSFIDLISGKLPVFIVVKNYVRPNFNYKGLSL